MQIHSILKSIPIFKNLNDSSINAIAIALREKGFNRGDYIFYEGDKANSFGIVLAGRVKILKHSMDGKEIILRIITETHIFGEVAMFDNLPYPASAIAMEDSKILLFEKEAFLQSVKKEPSIAWHIIIDLAQKLRDTSQALKDVAGERVERRIASLLLRLAEHYGEQKGETLSLNFPITRQEIADMCGTTVETAIRTMSKFTKDGLIETEKGIIRILKPVELQSIIEGE